MASRLLPRRSPALGRVLYAASAALLAGSLVALATALPSRASTPGSDWGSDGVMAPSSPVTVSWDNGGSTPSYDQVVAREPGSTQPLPHTGGKTYSDIPAAVNNTVASDFGNLQLTVSQTTGLRHQGVNLTVTGASAGTGQTPNSLLIMQCWGSADQTAPDPEDCQDGAGTVDGGSYVSRRFSSADNASGFVAHTDFKAETGVNLYGQVQGGGFEFTAPVSASVFVPSGEQNLATGAHGTVEVLDPNLTDVGSAKVVNGVATITVPDPQYSMSSYTAEYVATSTENFYSSVRSAPAVNLAYHASSTPGIGDNTSPSLTSTIPFMTVGGTTVPASSIDGYFTQTTTNEIGSFPLPSSANATSSRTFEVQTGAESPGLGCGVGSATNSTSTCWIVAVPFDDALPASYQLGVASPLTPSLWAQRLQVRLSFAPVSSYCSSGTHEASIGSELLEDAMNAWIPAICTSAKVNLGYVETTDDQARDEYTSDSGANLIFTSAPVDDSGSTSTLYAPAGLSAVTISVLSINGDTRTPVTGIRLNARLVAKLLTESYQNAIDPGNALPATNTPWYTTMPPSLVSDPEFKALNPDFPATATLAQSDLVVTVAGTDATTALWSWMWNDPEAKSFLSGCPDSASEINGQPSVVNPFYSARTYVGCSSEASALDAVTKAEISPKSTANPSGTVLPSTFVYSTPNYPPSAQAFPQPGYYERPPASTATGATPLTLADLHPRENTMSAVATDVLRGQEKTLDVYCTDGSTCPGTVITPPGVWINSAQPNFGSGVLGVTDGTAAAADLLPTALLCDDSGSCVGADNASLQKAASAFTPSSTDAHFLAAPTQPDISAGAYPLTLPVYAEINTKGLNATDASAYAAVLKYISGAGQTQGYDVGDLPPGMAPLTATMLKQDATAISTLEAIKPTVEPSTPSPSAATSGAGGTSSGTGSSFGSGPADQVPPVNSAPATGGSPSTSARTPQTASTPTTTSLSPTATAAITPKTPVGPLPIVVGGGLGASIACGIAAPLVGRSRKVAS